MIIRNGNKNITSRLPKADDHQHAKMGNRLARSVPLIKHKFAALYLNFVKLEFSSMDWGKRAK